MGVSLCVDLDGAETPTRQTTPRAFVDGGSIPLVGFPERGRRPMTDEKFNLSRRKTLAALGTIGVASAGAGLGTSAYFSDQETFENNQLTAGTLDMKVAATEYYSDWSPDEAEFAGMADDKASTDIRLPPGDDQDDAQAIALDLDDDYEGDGDVYAAFFDAISSDADGTPYNRVNGGVSAAAEGLCGTDSDADGPVIIDIADVKPGDFGGTQFAFELCDNPGYVWLTGGLRDASENGVTEPEADDPDEQEGVVELLDEIQVAYGVGPINDGNSAFADTDAGFQPTNQQSLREFLATVDGEGLALDGNIDAEEGGGTGDQGCFSGSPADGSTVHEVSVVWWLPINHGNQVQSDSATFDLGFYTEQCRHNDGETALDAYYPFEGTANDVSGNDYDGTLNGGVSFTSGQVGQAASFDGEDTRVTVAADNETLDAQTDISVSVWVYPTAHDSSAYNGIVGSHQNSGPYSGWAIAENRSGNLGLWSDTSGWSNTSQALPLDEWTHIVVTRSATESTATVYVDGTEATTAPWQVPTSNDRPLFIGDRADGEGPPFNGLIDDVRIYSRALSASEVQDIYDSA
jgi:predicted ribosomally synthesized peptide with SipW-like signal peptide